MQKIIRLCLHYGTQQNAFSLIKTVFADNNCRYITESFNTQYLALFCFHHHTSLPTGDDSQLNSL